MSSILVALSVLLSLFSTCSSANPHSEFITNTISSHNIVIFSKTYCPHWVMYCLMWKRLPVQVYISDRSIRGNFRHCRKAKSVFKELNMVPYVVELNERDDGAKIQDAMMGMIGRRTVPQVFINGKILGGGDDTVNAYESGELAKLLGISDQKEEL